MKILSRKTLSLLAGLCLLSFFPLHGAQAGPGNQVVVELYTSQGCKSCPPADRQRHYAAALRNRSVYTPQMVIGGRQHAVGSDASAVEAAIEAERRDGNGAPDLRLAH